MLAKTNLSRLVLLAGLLYFSPWLIFAQEITQINLKKHIKYLASDELAGRYPGTDGDKKTAEYIRNEFRKIGLKLNGTDGFQTFEATVKIKAGKDNLFQVDDFKAKAMVDFIPAGFSAKSSLNASVVFAGYGLQAQNDTFKWNDFKGTDLKGKWCMLLRGTPEIPKASELFISGTKDRDKAMLAKDLGAAGILFVSGVDYDKFDELPGLSYKEGMLDIPVLFINRNLANSILHGNNFTIASIEEQIKKGNPHHSLQSNLIVVASADVEPIIAKTENVIGVIEGKDPALKNEFVVIGAHFDHLGMGGFGSGSRVPDTIAVHHGADDNASGVASLIELARRFSYNQDSLKRTLVFICFSAEEEGLLGSKYFTEHPLIDLKQVEAMVNLDMVGRLREDNSLQVNGTGTSLEATRILSYLNRDSAFKYAFYPEGYGPSDHTSFYAKDIPVFFFTTGAHVDYHTPRDSYETINYEGLKKVSDFVYRLALDLDQEPARLSFREAGPKTQETGRYRLKVTLGIMPDFTSTDNKGLRADLVTPGKPAFKAGMLKGDVIVSINGKSINNIQDYMYRMSKISQGEIVNVEVMRNGKKEVLIVQL